MATSGEKISVSNIKTQWSPGAGLQDDTTSSPVEVFFDVVQLKLYLFLGLSPFIFDLFDEKKGWSTSIHNYLIIAGCSAETWFSSVLEAATLAPVSSIFSSSSSQASTVTSGPIVTIC